MGRDPPAARVDDLDAGRARVRQLELERETSAAAVGTEKAQRERPRRDLDPRLGCVSPVGQRQAVTPAAGRRGRIDVCDPTAGIRAPKSARRLPSALSPDEAARLVTIAGDDPLAVRDRALFELAYSSGLRLSELAGLDVGYAPVNTLLEATFDPQVAARGLLLDDEQGRRHLAPPIRFAAEPSRPRLREPQLGEHTAEILGELDGAAPQAGSESGA